jgi:hypothetical protein
MYPGSLVDVRHINKSGKDVVLIRRGIFLRGDQGKYTIIRFSKKLGFEPVITDGNIVYSSPKANDIVIDIRKPSDRWLCLGRSDRKSNPGFLVRNIDDNLGQRGTPCIESAWAVALFSSSSHVLSDVKTKISIGESKETGWLRGIDDEGLVVEFESPVGEHSYDGIFKARHCSIIPPEKIFENAREVSDEDKLDGSEDS